MGFAMAAGMSAQLIKPDRRMVTIMGDGDALMTFQDLETAMREKIPVKLFILNDGAYRVLLYRQRLQLGGRVYGTQHSNPDFARLAESFGAKGWRLENPEDVPSVVQTAMDSEGTVVVDVMIDDKAPAPTNLLAVAAMIQAAQAAQ
jgi:acetolactate synthase-1/2/3 large subunit